MNENIAKALVKAQAEMPVVPFDSVNPFLKNRYAGLGSVIETVRPVLAKHGLAFTQLSVGKNGEVGVKTILMHESGEFIEDTIMLPLSDEKGKSAAQVAGSIITYLRRYSLASILGVYADEDTDGNQPPPTKQKAPAAQKAASVDVFETVKSSNGELYKDLPIDKLSFMFSALVDNLKKDGLTQQNRDELELKRDAAQYYIKTKKG